MDPHAGRIVLNGAVSQYARALAPAEARRVRVDGRSQAELLRFAARFGELVWFYDLADQPDGDWSAFFLADPATLAATLRHAAPRAREAAHAALAERLLRADGAEAKGALLRGLFAAQHALARQVDAWLRALAALPASGPAERLQRRLAEAVAGHLAPALRRLRAWDAGAGAREALGAPVGLDYGGFLPLWELGAAAPDPSLFHGATTAKRLDHAAAGLVEAFAAGVDALAGIGRGAAELEAAGGAAGRQKPQIALWAAFVRLFRTAQRTLDSLTPRYARFYYHRVLREGPAGAIPDRVYLAFTLADDAGPRATVPRGTLFPAGADAEGREVVYAADRALGVTAASLARIRMLRAVPGPLVVAFTPAGSPPGSPRPAVDGERVPVQRVLASTVPAGPDAPAEADPAGWLTFGAAAPGEAGVQATAPATLGFAVASPELLLTGGRRRVRVAVRFSADRALERRVAAVAGLTGATPPEVLRQVLEGALFLDLSTAGGWFRLEGYRASAASPPGSGATFTLCFELPASVPPVVPLYAGAEAPEPAEGEEPPANPAPGLPTLRATLRPGTLEVAGPDGTATVYPLPFLETVRVRGVDVGARVEGLADLVVANTDGEVGPGGPFPVFGAEPATGSFLELRSVELFSKVPCPLSVSVGWLALPPNDLGFAGWYRDYEIGLDGHRTRGLFDNQVFRGRMRVVDPGRWLLATPGSPGPVPYEPVYLFRTLDDCANPVPAPEAPLCAETRFDGLAVTRTRAVPAYYDPARSALRLELSDPPYAFGNDLYAPNVLDAVLRDLPDGCACQEACAAACAPLNDAAAALARCVEACAGSPPGDPCVACLEEVRERLAARAAECFTACGASPPGGCGRCERMAEGVERIDACIAAAIDGLAAAACVEACAAWLAEAYTAALAACIRACMRPDGIRYPSDPYLPQAEWVSVSYASGCSIDPGGAGECGGLYHLEPFGGWRPMAAEGAAAPPLLPRAGAGLLLGFDALAGGGTLTLLFQMAAPGGTAEPATPPPVEWSRLEGDCWELLPPRALPADGTFGLRGTGIVALELPPFGAAGGTRVPGGEHWLRCEALGEPVGFPCTVGIFPHAAGATWVDTGEPAGVHLAQPLPAGTITSTVQDVAGLGGVLQPLPSFGGRPPETEPGYEVRLSERLRHKDRAEQGWDYERLVLERFPQVWKVQALPARAPEGPAPGSVLVVVVAGAEGNESADATVPRAASTLLGAVRDYLAERSTPFASIDVVNPAYVRVTVEAEVVFRGAGAGGDAGGGIDRLNGDLVAWLSPWFYDAERATHEGTYASEGDISEFIQTRPYVEALLSLELRHDPRPSTLEWYFLTSAGRHVIREPWPAGGYR